MSRREGIVDDDMRLFSRPRFRPLGGDRIGDDQTLEWNEYVNGILEELSDCQAVSQLSS